MVVQSGNDACVVLAEGLAGSQQAFIEQMNQKAQEIGLRDSHFANVDGLPSPEHWMTARDLATLAVRTIEDFPEYYKYYSEKEYKFNNISQGNRNPLLYKDLGADGLKTGHTEEAGYSLLASVKRRRPAHCAGAERLAVDEGAGAGNRTADRMGVPRVQ